MRLCMKLSCISSGENVCLVFIQIVATMNKGKVSKYCRNVQQLAPILCNTKGHFVIVTFFIIIMYYGIILNQFSIGNAV